MNKKLHYLALAAACIISASCSNRQYPIATSEARLSVTEVISDSSFVCEVPFIAKDDSVHIRKVMVYTPGKVTEKIPLIYNAHYGIRFTDGYVQRALNEGMAVACPYESDEEMNKTLLEDDLVFNNAALYCLRNLDFVDKSRVVICGESAGGYMTLMLSSLQMGICAASARYPLINPYFNFNIHFRNAHKVNLEFQELGKGAQFSVIEYIYDAFMPSADSFASDKDIARWEAVSPLGLAQCVSAPILIHHFTSDMLVPMDQLCRDYTRQDVGESVPEGYSVRMSRDLPGILGQSYVESLPEGSCITRLSKVSDNTKYTNLEYDPDYLVNIDIFDDGPTEAYASHRVDYGTGYFDDHNFVTEMLGRTLSDTEKLVPDKLALLLDRYNGNSLQLPAHYGCPQEIYGSIEMYRRQIVDELSLWAECNSLEELESAMKAVTKGNREYKVAWKDIRRQLFSSPGI